eukprot:g13592.t1
MKMPLDQSALSEPGRSLGHACADLEGESFTLQDVELWKKAYESAIGVCEATAEGAAAGGTATTTTGGSSSSASSSSDWKTKIYELADHVTATGDFERAFCRRELGELSPSSSLLADFSDAENATLFPNGTSGAAPFLDVKALCDICGQELVDPSNTLRETTLTVQPHHRFEPLAALSAATGLASVASSLASFAFPVNITHSNVTIAGVTLRVGDSIRAAAPSFADDAAIITQQTTYAGSGQYVSTYTGVLTVHTSDLSLFSSADNCPPRDTCLCKSGMEAVLRTKVYQSCPLVHAFLDPAHRLASAFLTCYFPALSSTHQAAVYAQRLAFRGDAGTGRSSEMAASSAAGARGKLKTALLTEALSNAAGGSR